MSSCPKLWAVSHCHSSYGNALSPRASRKPRFPGCHQLGATSIPSIGASPLPFNSSTDKQRGPQSRSKQAIKAFQPQLLLLSKSCVGGGPQCRSWLETVPLLFRCMIGRGLVPLIQPWERVNSSESTARQDPGFHLCCYEFVYRNKLSLPFHNFMYEIEKCFILMKGA